MQAQRKQVFDEINITPLTDIFLVLLITMMVVAPLMQTMRQDIKPPEIASGSQVDQSRLTVEVTQDGTFYVDGQAVPEAQLTDVLRSKSAQATEPAAAAEPSEAPADGTAPAPTASEKNVTIRADRTVKSGAVMKVFEAARDAEFTKVTVAGEPLSTARQGELQQQEGTANPAGPMGEAQ